MRQFLPKGKVMRTFVTAFVILFAVSTFADASGPLVRSYPFEPGVGGYPAYRIPALVTANSGTLLAFFEARQTVTSDTHNIDLAVRRSTDGGETWGPIQVVFDNGTGTAGCPVPIVDRTTGDIVLLMDTNPYESLPRSSWVMRSSDDGLTWSTPVDITSSVRDPRWEGWTGTGPGHGIQLKRGAHAGRLLAAQWYFAKFPHKPIWEETGTQVIYSDDGGHTWNRGGCIFPKGDEGTLVELTNGDICLNLRDSIGNAAPDPVRLVAYSSDGGESFGPSELEYDLPARVSAGALLRYSAVDQGDDTNRVLVSIPTFRPILGGPMTVFSSFDETKNWPDKKIIDIRAGFYSDMTVLPDGQIGILYENRGMFYARFSIDWLDDPSRVFWGFDEQEPGNNASTGRYAIKDTRGYGLDGTADSAFAYVPGSPSYGGTSALRFVGGGGGVRLTDNEPLATSYKNNLLDFEYLENHVHARDFTVEAVVRSTAGGSGGGAIVAKDADPNSPSWWLGIESGKLRFSITDGHGNQPEVVSSGTVTDGNWHHVAAVRDSKNSQLRLYCDKQLVGTADDVTTVNYAIDGSTARISDATGEAMHDHKAAGIVNMYKSVAAAARGASEYSLEADLYVEHGGGGNAGSTSVSLGFGTEANGPRLFYSRWMGSKFDDKWYLVVGSEFHPLGDAGEGADDVVRGTIALNLDDNTVSGTIAGGFGTISTTHPYAHTSGTNKVFVLSDRRYGPVGIDLDNIVVKQDGVETHSEDFNAGSDAQDISDSPFGWRDTWSRGQDMRITDDTKHNTSVPNDKDVVVGSSNAGGEDFVGDIDFVRVSAGALTSDDFIQTTSSTAKQRRLNP